MTSSFGCVAVSLYGPPLVPHGTSILENWRFGYALLVRPACPPPDHHHPRGEHLSELTQATDQPIVDKRMIIHNWIANARHTNNTYPEA